jgi:hypothetical protein
MPGITITLVDHTQDTSQDHESYKAQILHEFANIFSDLLSSSSDPTVVNVRWLSQSPQAGDQDLVVHWVQDQDHSYLRTKWSTVSINPAAGGHTYNDGVMVGSEFYRRPRLRTALAYAKIAAHEAMHNITRLGNHALHGQMGLAGDAGGTPQLPVTTNDRSLVQAGLQRGLRPQLL